jgi:hypothetical protein
VNENIPAPEPPAVTPGQAATCPVAFIPSTIDSDPDAHVCTCDQPEDHEKPRTHHCPTCDCWWALKSEQGIAPAGPQPAPELQAVESAYLYHWRFERGEEFGLYRHAADANAKAAEHAGDGLTEVLGMAILGRPVPQPAPGLAAYEADIASLTDQRNRVSETADHLREVLDEIGVMAANAPEDGDSFGVLEEIAMRIAAVDVPDTTPVLAAVKRERDAARADRAHLRAALATLTDRTEGSTVLTEDERAEYRKLVDAMGPFAPGRDGAAPELAAPVTGRTPGAAAAPELADVLSKRFFHLASELENEAPESDGSAVAQTARAIARRIRKGLDE